MEKHTSIEEKVHSGFYQEDRFFRYVDISCPCGKSYFQTEREECNKDGIFKYFKIGHYSWKILLHIERQIRLNGSSEHIKILIDILGDEKALELLEFWAKKNIVIGLALIKFIKELKKKTLRNMKGSSLGVKR